MTVHLLAMTVGPVQEFIAAARRTRDLWFGSYLLSEISKAAAKTVRNQGGSLIFPAPSSDADLEPCSALNVANVILAELDGLDPAEMAKAAKDAACSRWRSFADHVFQRHRAVIQTDIWDDQVDDVIEFFATWVAGSPETFRADRARLMRLLAGRKRCRNFLPAKGRAGVPKSSLDGLRESLLRPPREWPELSRRRMRMREGEQLDVVAMVKRTWVPGTGPLHYPSVARVAADPWLRGVGPSRLEAMIDACRRIGNDALREIDVSEERGHTQYATFPFEGTAVFRSRHRDLQEEAELSDADIDPLAGALASLTQGFGEPNPYLAVLVADGDRIGQVISRLESTDSHRKLSKALAAFAGETRQIVHAHNGILVYAGGDDVLAFVPVDRCLMCARMLRDKFGDALAAWSANDGKLTLSVGLAVAHFMEPLEDLLEYGRTAERHAKKPRAEDGEQDERDGLAVHVLKRGGRPLAVRANWSDRPDEHLLTLAGWIAAGELSVRVAYELRTVAEQYDSWPSDTVQDAIRGDAISVILKKQHLGGSRKLELDITEMIRERVSGADSLRCLADEILVARQIAASLVQARNAS
ncbi:MAG: type III-B CRISPR-associated protein Cas10/Cmr2 [Nitrospiraceae bacterium]|nr:type III-B CRISPR-associated protein Cas10/Cmr2 [Nitrospiraceae bacterium]